MPRNPDEVFAMILSPEQVQGAESDRTLALPDRAKILDLQIVIEPPEAHFYNVEFVSSNRSFEKRFEKISLAQIGDTWYLDVRVPTDSMNPGTYLVHVIPAAGKGKEVCYRLTIANRK